MPAGKGMHPGKLTHSVPPWPHTRLKTPPRASHVGLGYMGWESTPKTPPIYLFGVGVAVPYYTIHVDTLYTIFTFRVAMAHGIIFVRLCGLGGIGGHHRPGSERQTSPGTATKPLQHDFFFWLRRLGAGGENLIRICCRCAISDP